MTLFRCQLAVIVASPFVLPIVTLEAQRSRVSLSASTVTIGEESGGDAEFAKIEAVVRDSASGILYVLDSRKNEVRAFDPRGKLLSVGGKPGTGPGDLGEARSLALDEKGSVHVLELSNLRISVFGKPDPAKSTLAFDRTIRLPVFGASMCKLDTHYVLMAQVKDSLFHRVDGSGSLIGAFGSPFRLKATQAHAVMDRSLSKGHVRCDRAHDIVIATAVNVGEVRAYARDGRLLWSHAINGYIPLNIYPSGPGVVTYAPRAGGWHETATVTLLRGGIVLVQAKFTDEAHSRKREHMRVDSFLLAASTGELLGVQTDLPLIVYADSSVVVAATDDPFPRVSVHDYKVGRL